MNSNEEILLADYGDPDHARILIELLDEYARHPMGGGRPLSETTKSSLVSELARVPGAFSLIALVDGEPAGLANCFQGFSTFACKPLINPYLSPSLIPPCASMVYFQKIAEWHYKAIIL